MRPDAARLDPVYSAASERRAACRTMSSTTRKRDLNGGEPTPSVDQTLLQPHRQLIGSNLLDAEGDLGDGHGPQGKFGIMPDKPGAHRRIRRSA